MFTIQAAVTIVTAGLAAHFFGISADISVWGSLIIIISSSLLIIGKYNLLDKLMKLIIVILSICTFLSFILAINNSTEFAPLHQILPKDSGLLFLIAFMGWMPAPMDISIWHSIWSVEKQREIKNISFKETIYDFNVGYITTIFLGFCFIGLGSLVMFNTEIEFSDKGLVFAGQLIDLYTLNLGKSFTGIISLAAFTTMLSTTITTLDASPRAFSKTIQLLFEKDKDYYLFFLFILSFGTIGIFLFFQSEMGFLVQIATVLSFLTTPFFAWINLKLITSEFIPKKFRPSKLLIIFSWFGLVFLSAFTIGYLLTL
tara:strand:- start:169 stop:1110 length:942 start_codon:yes stop_codon:yes gene_type:complete